MNFLICRIKFMNSAFVISVWCLIVFSGCKKENMCDCLKGAGDMTTERRILNDFSRLEVKKNVSVQLIQDTINYAEVNAGGNLIPLIRTKTESGILKIDNDNTCNWVRSYKNEIVVTVHYKQLDYITHYGSGDIICINALVTKTLETMNFSSGDVYLKLNTDESFAKLMGGAGDIYLEGYTRFSYLYSASFGYGHAQHLTNELCQVDQRGTGDIHVQGNQSLSVYIEQLGNVYYSGNPQELNLRVLGKGQLIKE